MSFTISSDLLWKAAFVIIWAAMSVIRLPYGKAHKAAPKKASMRPGLEAMLVGLNSLSMMLAPMLVVFSPWLDSFEMGLPLWVRGLAVALFAADAVFFYWVHKNLGRNWSPVLDIKKEHRLVQEGPYKYMRHPMYTQIWVWVSVQGLVLDNWFLEIFGLLSWALLYFSRVPREEKLMADEFGEEYLTYCRRTGRLFPKLSC